MSLISGAKSCSQCKDMKDLEEFSIDRQKRDGRNVACRQCMKDAYHSSGKYERNFASTLRLRYDLTVERYEEMLAEQHGGCAACGAKPFSVRAYGRRLAVDHDHSCCPGRETCGRCVRGLLCASCNRTLGHTEDDPNLLLRLADYALRRTDVLGAIR